MVVFIPVMSRALILAGAAIAVRARGGARESSFCFASVFYSTHASAHARTHTRPHACTHTQSRSMQGRMPNTRARALSLSLFLALALSLTHFLSFSLSLSLFPTQTQTHTCVLHMRTLTTHALCSSSADARQVSKQVPRLRFWGAPARGLVPWSCARRGERSLRGGCTDARRHRCGKRVKGREKEGESGGRKGIAREVRWQEGGKKRGKGGSQGLREGGRGGGREKERAALCQSAGDAVNSRERACVRRRGRAAVRVAIHVRGK